MLFYLCLHDLIEVSELVLCVAIDTYGMNVEKKSGNVE